MAVSEAQKELQENIKQECTIMCPSYSVKERKKGFL